MRRLLVAVIAAAALGGCGGEEPAPATFTNPVYASDAPDPQAIRAGDTWYLFHTNAGGHNVPVLTSPDLVSWTPAGDALPALGPWAASGKTWAPEVIALAPDRYVLYYTAASAETGRQCLGRAVATAPAGPYVDDADAPLVCQAALGGSIDASPFRDADDSLHLLWKNDGNAIGEDTWIWSQPLAPSGTALTGAPTRLVKQTEPWEGVLVEGPFFWRRPEGLFLFYAGNAYDTSSYAEGYAVCDSPAGPCRKAAENPVLRSAGRASGPGHASMVEKDGRTWLLYHAWPTGEEGAVDPGRQVWLDEVVWTDGKPVVRGPTSTPQPLP
jgi:beta-xylosidase